MKSSKKLMVLCLAAAWGSSSILLADAQTISALGSSDLSKEIESVNQKLNEHIEHGQAQDAIISDGVRNVAAAVSDNYHSINKLHSWISEIDKLKVNHADLDGAVASINNHISSVEKNVVDLSNDVKEWDQKTNSRIDTTNDRVREAAKSALAANKGVTENAVTLDKQRRAIIEASSDAIVAKNVAARADSLSHDNRDWINQHEVESKAMQQTINQNTDLIAKKAERADLASLNNKLEEEMFDRENTEDVLMNNTQVNKQEISKVKDGVSDLSDKVSDHSMAIKALKGNKADKAETEAALGNLKDQVSNEANTRRKNEHHLAHGVQENKDQIQHLAGSVDAKLDQDDFVAFQQDQSSKHQAQAKKLVDHESRLGQSEAKDIQHDQKLANHEERLVASEQTVNQQGKTLEKHQTAIDGNAKQIAHTQQKVNANASDIALLNSKVDYNSGRITKLDDKVNKGLALMSAMSSVDVGGVSVGKIRVAGAVGGYANKQAIAFGVATALTNDFRINAKVSVSTDDSKTNAYAIGASYDF